MGGGYGGLSVLTNMSLRFGGLLNTILGGGVSFFKEGSVATMCQCFCITVDISLDNGENGMAHRILPSLVLSLVDVRQSV